MALILLYHIFCYLTIPFFQKHIKNNKKDDILHLLHNHSSVVTQVVTQSNFTQTKSVVSVTQKHVTTLLIKLCDKTRNKASGCGAVGSALPWGGRGRKFKSCHSDQKGDSQESPFFFVFRPKSPIFSHFAA